MTAPAIAATRRRTRRVAAPARKPPRGRPEVDPRLRMAEKTLDTAVRQMRPKVDPRLRMAEKTLDTAVRQMLKQLMLSDRSFHPPDGTGRYTAGLPDWLIVGPGGIIWRELKTEKGRITGAQKGWMADLAAHGCDVDVWRPSDLISGRIARELAVVAGLPVRDR